MMKLRATRNNQMHYCDREVLQLANEEQHRLRLNGAEREAYIAFATALNLLDRNVPVLEDVSREASVLKRMRFVRTMTRNIILKINEKVNLDQLISLSNNCKDVTVTISIASEPGYYNVRRDHLHAICDQAMESCRISCAMTRDQSKDCPVRRALESIPGVRDVSKAQGNTKDCPFAGMSLDWEVPEE